MLLWFIGVGCTAVVLVFKSPALDYRVVALGTVLPLVDVVPGVPPILHTLLGAVALLAVVMLATRGRRLSRRRWLGLPIGVLVHLVIGGAWLDEQLFWWPAFGTGLPDVAVPTMSSLGVALVLDALGAVALWWAWRQFRLDDPARRHELIHHGRLDRDLVP
jgi:nitrogen fixation-related uncharacterized protein